MDLPDPFSGSVVKESFSKFSQILNETVKNNVSLM